MRKIAGGRSADASALARGTLADLAADAMCRSWARVTHLHLLGSQLDPIHALSFALEDDGIPSCRPDCRGAAVNRRRAACSPDDPRGC
jgi:hypothetical protein